MWAMPTSQSLFFSTLLGRVQFRDTSFVDQKEVVSTSVKWFIFSMLVKEQKIPKAQFQSTETRFGDFWED